MLKLRRTRLWSLFSGTEPIRCNVIGIKAISTLSDQQNLILMGSPGAGKTTIGQHVARRLEMPVLDVDNDHLELHWAMAVADKLKLVGPDNFLEEEGQALLKLSPSNTVISLTGSNPLHQAAMDHIKSTGLVVFIDVAHEDIIERLERMKVDRIVGQGGKMSMLDILRYRQQFYEGSYDIRIIVEKNEDQASIAEKIILALQKYKHNSGYRSTRSAAPITSDIHDKPNHSFNDIVLEGLASDGGLYVPVADIPHFSLNELSRMVGLPYKDKALRVLEKWIHMNDLHPAVLKDMVDRAYSETNFNCCRVMPVVDLGGGQYFLELFHGPTASFKDAALQLMPQFFQHAVKEKGMDERYLILVATSGDTGGAVLDGFSKYAGPHTSVMVLYPENGISNIQKTQMTTFGGDNIKVIGVKSDFDFCQSAIKKIFSNQTLKNRMFQKHNCKFSAANSINWGRLLPQIVYHVSAYLDLVQDRRVSMGDQIDVCIPTGNFGNILGAWYAKQMGIPINQLILASNKNNILTEFFTTGQYNINSRVLQQTMSPAIDILKSSNLERFLFHISDCDHEAVKSWYSALDSKGCFALDEKLFSDVCSSMTVGWASEEDCANAINKTFKQTGYLMDPHTAVSKVVADRHFNPNRPMVVVSTAHYAKFADDVMHCLDNSKQFSDLPIGDLFQQLNELKPRPRLHWAVQELATKPRVQKTVCEADIGEIEKEIQQFLECQ